MDVLYVCAYVYYMYVRAYLHTCKWMYCTYVHTYVYYMCVHIYTYIFYICVGIYVCLHVLVYSAVYLYLRICSRYILYIAYSGTSLLWILLNLYVHFMSSLWRFFQFGGHFMHYCTTLGQNGVLNVEVFLILRLV